MTKLNILPLLTFFIAFNLVDVMSSDAQATQTIRGRVIDAISNAPLPGANVVLLNSGSTFKGSISDAEGIFRVEGVLVGRHSIKVTFIGYEEQTIPNIVVTAGKEIVLSLSLTESISQLSEVTVTDDTRADKTATNNDLAVVSARSFNVDDTKRYAGAIGDPSRMAANFAGVVGGNDSRNDIVVRGNSPTGMLWQLEGMNIPNPNHFGALVSTGGPVSMLNNNNLDKSDFMTSAFPAQYGNATAGVFDIKLRDGNNEKRELMGQIGFNGFEAGAEGPLKTKSGGSYIANYRYSTLGVFQALGIEFGTGSNTPLYQDMNFKVSLPTANGGKWSIFGLGGISSIDLLGSKADLSSNTNLYGNENDDSFANYGAGVLGISYEKTIKNSYIRVTAGASTTREKFDSDSLVRNTKNEVISAYKRAEGNMKTQKYSFNFYTRTKFNAKNSLTSGLYIDLSHFNLFNRELYANLNRDSVRLDVRDNAILYQGYSTWKHRFNQNFIFNAGVHAQYYSLASEFVVEPRTSFQYIIDAKHSVAIGYGIHNQAQNVTTSFIQTRTLAGQILTTNKDLGFTTSQHMVLTYDWNITSNMRIKTEAYYQRLSNVPVQRRPTSYSALNGGISFGIDAEDSLANAGSGRNYGLELTLERFFSKGYYFLITTSLFDSKYKGSDGILRNTAFNTNYVFNALAGKEWQIGGGKNFISVNIKLTTIGGKRLTPVNFEASQQRGTTVYDENNAFGAQQTPYFRTDLRLTYRKEYAHSTLETSLDLQNLTNHKNVFLQSYNPRTNTVITQYQQSFFPVPYVRFTF
ncbi:MAG: TonB-dependent receptor [Chryseolinea sp.]